MSAPVKTRSYSNERRARLAQERRRSVLEAAAQSFAQHGYARTAMADVAAQAGVALDTVYALVGRKPALLLAVHDLILGDQAVDEDGLPVPAAQRAYVERVRSAATANEKIRLYAEALGRLLPRTAPLMNALREAGATEPACREVWEQVEARRAANMLLFAADLRATGEVREDLSDDDVADLVWSMNAADYFTRLEGRGWTPERYAALVREVWTRTFLA